jgi:pimeloyl-ACP methyl ester carboxylesterase
MDPAWTLHGRPVPFTRMFDEPHPTDDPRAVIAVEHIDGPILMNCGTNDTVWTSCAYGHAVMARLAESRYPHRLLECDGCDHYVSRWIPGEPSPLSGPESDHDKLAYPAFFAATLALLGSNEPFVDTR